MTIRVMTYNVRYFGHRTGGIAARDRTMATVAKRLATLPGGPPDIVCLQEVETTSLRADVARRRQRPRSEPRRPQLERFMEVLRAAIANEGLDADYTPHYFPAHEYKLSKRHNVYTTGLAVLISTRFAVRDHNADGPYDITHRRFRRFARLKQTRVCGHVAVETDGGLVLDIFNTHLSLPAFLTRDIFTYTMKMGHGLNQLAEVRRLVEFVERARTPGSHLLLVGDFNSRPTSPVYQYLTEEVGLTDAYRDHNDDLPPHARDYPTAGAFGARLPIDYIFCDGPVAVDFEQTHTYTTKGGRFKGLSDHVPLIARFELGATPEADRSLYV